jgi:probable phosphoglycerate mutase
MIRHLPTSYNQEERLQGRLNIPILLPDEAEQKKIHQNQFFLKDIGEFDKTFCSTLKRTQMTAECYGRACTVEPLLDELDFGIYEALEKSFFLKKVGNLWLKAPETLILGEPVTALADRIHQFLEYICHTAKRVLIFGHGAWIRACVACIQNGTLHEMNRLDIHNNELIHIQFSTKKYLSKEQFSCRSNLHRTSIP